MKAKFLTDNYTELALCLKSFKTSCQIKIKVNLLFNITRLGARGVMVIVVGNGHGDTSSNTGRD